MACDRHQETHLCWQQGRGQDRQEGAWSGHLCQGPESGGLLGACLTPLPGPASDGASDEHERDESHRNKRQRSPQRRAGAGRGLSAEVW